MCSKREPDKMKRKIDLDLPPNATTNELTIVVAVRSLLLKEKAGKLAGEHIGNHAPGIGKHFIPILLWVDSKVPVV